ncbi:hypothetical protein GY12_12560 [Micrococcus luteus]|nr:hypothetical protein GY12_12560 [Micrococcus luteus]
MPTMLVRAEDRCATVAAASIAAKVARDDAMIALDAAHPGVRGGPGTRGTARAAHRAALAERGASEQHRRSWNLGLPGAPAEGPPTLFD